MNSTRQLAKQIISEATGDPISAAPAAAPQANQVQAPPSPEDNQANELAIEANMKQALDVILQQLPGMAQNYARSQGDKDGKLEIKPNQQAVNEIVATLAGAALALPAITNMMGKATHWLGKQLDHTALGKAGESVMKFATKWHHAYENSIYKFLRKMMPANATDDQVKQASKVLFLAIIGTMGVAAGAGAMHMASQGKAGLAGFEAALGAIKGNELAGPVKNALVKIFQTYFS